jgi:hypothetical protein
MGLSGSAARPSLKGKSATSGRLSMILFDLRCANGHEFEGWFKDSATYDQQAAAGEISCAICGDNQVDKALMAPAVRSSGPRPDPATARLGQALRKLRDHIERTHEHVGPTFAEEARKIHYGEAEKRDIYGEATAKEAKALKDEGVPVAAIPWLPRQDG